MYFEILCTVLFNIIMIGSSRDNDKSNNYSNNKCQQSQINITKCVVPLLSIPQSKIQIYSDCIVKQNESFLQAITADTGQFSTIVDDAKIQQSNIDCKQKYLATKLNKSLLSKIMFNNPDLAFKIQDADKRIQIHNLATHSIILQFKVYNLQTLLTVQSLLRRKMCELGFQNKYKKVKILGKGATAQVHLVQRISDGRKFAAKIISLKQSNQKAYQTFINESKLLRQLRHRNIINLESLYIYKKDFIQVMEYLDGGTLLQLVKNNEVQTKKQKWKILRDITMGLDYLRQRRIVHRDIKMENILIRNRPQGKQYVISDFGLATWIGSTSLLFQRCGTPGYIAPQVLNAPKGKPVLDHKMDIFSLGAIAHILFLYQPLFSYNGNVKELLKINKKADISLNKKIYQDLSISQYTFLEMTLTKTGEKRASAQELIQQVKYMTTDHFDMSGQKSARKKQGESQNKKQSGVQVVIKKATSLTKTKISFDSNKSHRQEKSNQKQKQQNKKSFSARKMLSQVWASITSPSPKKQTLKIKQNSIQKQKKLIQYF